MPTADGVETAGSLGKEVLKLVAWGRTTRSGDRSDLDFDLGIGLFCCGAGANSDQYDFTSIINNNLLLRPYTNKE
mgnify:CR=1 FL=1